MKKTKLEKKAFNVAIDHIDDARGQLDTLTKGLKKKQELSLGEILSLTEKIYKIAGELDKGVAWFRILGQAGV